MPSRANAFRTMNVQVMGISWGLVDGRPVFMDSEEDCYFVLEPEEEAAILAALGAPPCTASVAGFDQPIPIASCPHPQASLLSKPRAEATFSLADIVTAWRLVAAARRSIRRRPIAELLMRIERGAAAGQANGALSRAALRFQAARQFVPIPRNCLTDSIALLQWLARQGQAATLVFGVKLNPFAAHCWVQSGALLLNDHVEHVERFTPVRVIACGPGLR